MKKKGISMALQLLITAIVLIVTALTVLIMVQNNVIGKPQQLQNAGDASVCIADRDTYCGINPNGCWDSASAFQRETSCEEIISNKPSYAQHYSCAKKGWFSEEEHEQIASGVLELKCGSSQS